MTRFLLTLDQSVDLVLHAMENAKGGEVFVRKAPACTVADLAATMAAKYSRRGAAHPIQVVGIRPGEKIHEVLVSEYEMQRATETPTYFTVHAEYATPKGIPAPRPVGEEYTSENTDQIKDAARLGALLDVAGKVEYFT